MLWGGKDLQAMIREEKQLVEEGKKMILKEFLLYQGQPEKNKHFKQGNR